MYKFNPFTQEFDYYETGTGGVDGDTTLEYTDGDITKITKVVDGEVKINEYVYVYTDGNLTKLTKTVDGVDYEKVFTYTNNILTNISAWSIV